MRKRLFCPACTIALGLLTASVAFAMRIESGVARYNSGQQVTFGQPFPSPPVVVTNAIDGGTAVSSCAMNNTTTGFVLTIRNYKNQNVGNALVQWIAFIPDPSMQVQGGVVKLNDGQQITFPSMSNVPTVVTNAQEPPAVVTSSQTAGAINSAPLNITKTGFKIALKDQDNNPVQGAWVQWIGVVCSSQNGFKGGRATRSSASHIGFNPPFASMPVLLNSAEKMGEPCAASALLSSPSGFYLSLFRHDGSQGNEFRAYTLGYVKAPAP